MELTKLSIQNFKCFKKEDVCFDSRMNLFIGENASGKTSILDALSVAVGSWLSATGKDNRKIKQDEIRNVVESVKGEISPRPQFPVTIKANGKILGEEYEWIRNIPKEKSKTTYKEIANIRNLVFDTLKSVNKFKEIVLPLISYYGTERLHSLPAATKKSPDPFKGKNHPFNGYYFSVDPRIHHKNLIEWLKKQEMIYFQERKILPAYNQVKKAIINCIEKCKDIRYLARLGGINILIEGQGWQPFSSLSDGQKSLFAMVGDIALKAATLNPHLGDDILNKTNGVVLIDEIELHLHPKWQSRIVEDLRNTFPQIQFFLTTHSPQVISSMKIGKMYTMKRNAEQVKITEVDRFYGLNSNWILKHSMGVQSRPKEIQKKMEEIERLLDSEKIEDIAEAKQKLETLKNLVYDDEIVRLESHIWNLEN